MIKGLPIPVIVAAVTGDGDALTIVVNHYKRIICHLATRLVIDEFGKEYLYVDEDMRLQLESKLAYSVLEFRVLPA